MKYKFIKDLTSDVMFEAYGKSLKELFENAALAISSIMCNLKKVKAIKPKTVDIKASNVEELIVDWLQKIIALVDIEEMFFSKFEIKKINEKSLKAKVYGEEIRPELGETVVKAVTNYGFKFVKNKVNYKVRVSLDI
jgi:SHS2 domain-containing protein